MAKLSLKTKINKMLETNFSIALSTDSITVLSVSEGVAKLLGFNAGDFVSNKVSLQTLIHSHDNDIVEALFSNTIKVASGRFNIRIRHADGRIRCIKGHFDKVLDSAQNCVILQLLLQDAKSLWQQQDDQSSMANFRAMMDNTDDYIYFKDRNHVFTGASQTLVSITDPSDHWTDLIGKTDYDVFPEEYADIYYRLEKQVFSSMNIAHEIQKTLDNQGNTGWVDNRKYPMHNKNADVIGLFGIARVITDVVIQQQKIDELLAKQSTIINNTLIGMATARNRTIIWANHTFETMLGYGEGELIDFPTRQFYAYDEDYQSVGDDYLNIESVGIVRNQLEFVRKDGSHIWVDIRGSGLEHKTGESLWVFVDVTERKQTEDALKNSEYYWKFAIEGAGDGVWDWDIGNNVKTFSKQWKAILGYAESDILPTGIEWENRFHPDDTVFVEQTMQAYLRGLEPTYKLECRMKCKDGSYRWVLSRGMVLKYGEDGIPLRMIGTISDITERKQADQRLRESEQRVRLSQFYGGIGTWELDFHSQYQVWSETITQQLGFPDLANPTYYDFISVVHSADRATLIKEVKRQIAQDNTIDVEYRILDTQGKVRWMRSIGKVDVNSAGHAITMQGTVQEITIQKVADHDLHIAATAFESQEGMIVTDAHNIILRVNKAFTIITGYSAEDAIGKKSTLLASGHHDAVFFDEMWNEIRTNSYWEGELWNKRKNGELYPQKLTITAVKDWNDIVTNYVATLIDITKSKQAEREIKDLAYYDSLTHLPNRRLMMDRINHAMATNTRSEKIGALVFLDLDYFKTLNDTLGHDMGDILLQQVAIRLTSCIRDNDTVSRFGGDEFVVLLEDLSELTIEAAAQAEDIANKFLNAINQPFHLNSHIYSSSSSIGITLFTGHQAGVDELLKQADIAMYQAKNDGRNAIRFFNPQMQTKITAHAKLENELKQAIEQQQFQLYYQIQVDNSLQPLGAEALIRWLHPKRGIVSPLDFIPLAEQNGAIQEIGRWVIDTACAQLKAWQQDVVTRDLTLSINVSAKQFHQSDFISQIKAAVQHFAINPSLLKLELTESLLLNDIEDTIAKMKALAKIGIQFSLDDFGTGYSSLQYLKKLPIYQLKIDKSFIDNIVTDSNDSSIVSTIIVMAHSLGLSVIAEGVETQAQQQLLLTKGCTHYQGYLYSKPVPVEQFEVLLRQHNKHI
jgi:diguanylate cyclase (GGDEF)-like protein/PAS domain S-box-containing protein